MYLSSNYNEVYDRQTRRDISIGFIMAKILMNIVLNRLSLFYESQFLTIQFSFFLVKSINGGVYVIKQFQEIVYLSPNRKLCTCYVDFIATQDYFNRDYLFSSIRNRLPSSDTTGCIDLIEKVYMSSSIYDHD